MNQINRTAIVTGASRAAGIGAALTETLAGAGINTFITYYRPYDAMMPWGSNDDEVQQLVGRVRALGVGVEALEVDLADITAPKLLFDAAEAAFGPVDILINNATHSERDGIENLTAATLDRHYAVNVRGMALLCAEFARRFQPRTDGGKAVENSGRIINLSSGQGVGPMPGELAYVATKGAVEAFTVTLSAELAPKGITVNAVDPGITDTGWITPALMTEFLPHMPYGRVGEPEDVARLIGFLVSDEGRWITGQLLHSRGGR